MQFAMFHNITKPSKKDDLNCRTFVTSPRCAIVKICAYLGDFLRLFADVLFYSLILLGK